MITANEQDSKSVLSAWRFSFLLGASVFIKCEMTKGSGAIRCHKLCKENVDYWGDLCL